MNDHRAVGLAVLMAVAFALGWRAHGGPAAFLGAVGLLLLFRFAMLWIGIHLAMLAGRPELKIGSSQRLYPGMSFAEATTVNTKNRSFALTAPISVPASGVVLSLICIRTAIPAPWQAWSHCAT